MSLIGKVVSYYKLDGNSTDSLSVSNGTDTSVSYVSAKISTGADLNGTTSKIDLNRTAHSATAGSVSCWVKWDTLAAVSRPLTDAAGYMYFELNGTNKIVFEFYYFGGNSIASSFTATTGTWYNLVATWDGTDTNFYIDGAFIGTVAAPGPQVMDLLTLGFVSPSYYFDGIVDEVGIFNDALTAGEVTTLYNGGAGLTYPFTVSTQNSNFFNFF